MTEDLEKAEESSKSSKDIKKSYIETDVDGLDIPDEIVDASKMIEEKEKKSSRRFSYQ